MSGTLWHRPENDLIEVEYAGVSIADMVVEATFVNPYAASANPWSYGFVLRAIEGGSSLMVMLTSQRRWAAISSSGPFGPHDEIAGGPLHDFAVGSGGTNHLMAIAIERRIWIFVNGDYVASVDVSGATEGGNVAVMTAAYPDHEVAGEATRYEDFRGYSLTRRYGPADGNVVSEEDAIGGRGSGVSTRDFIVEATFVNPPGSLWDYGFAVRNSTFNRLDIVALRYDGRWDYLTRDIDDQRYSEVASGSVAGSHTEPSKRNHLLLIAIRDAGWLFMNDDLLSKLDLSRNEDEGPVSILGYFWTGHRGEFEFTGFSVWAP